MRLTQYHRQAFVSAVMNDVPRTNHNEIAHKLAQDYLVEHMPPKVRAVFDDKGLRHYLVTTCTYFPGSISNAAMYGAEGGIHWWKQVPELSAKISEIAQQADEQCTQRYNLESKLRAIAKSCTTRAALAKALPEFEKYLPAEDAPSTNLPALANVVADFVQAGWPKGKKPQEATT
jgi:hypothetical protein